MSTNIFKLSIVVIFYNETKDQIKRAINSFLNKNYLNDYEIIVINNNKDLEFTFFLKKYINQISHYNIKLINSKINKVAEARKLGMLNSRSKWITFVDGDDYFLSNWAKDFFDFIKQYENSNEPIVICSNISYNNLNNNSSFIISYYNWYSFNFYWFAGSFFIKDYFTEQMFYQQDQWAEDLYMCLMYKKINNPIMLFLEKTLYQYDHDEYEQKHVGSVINRLKSEVFYLDLVYGNEIYFYKYIHLFSRKFISSLIKCKLNNSYWFAKYLKKFKKKQQMFFELNFFIYSNAFLFPLFILVIKIFFYFYQKLKKILGKING